MLEKAGLSKGPTIDVSTDRVTAGFAAALPSRTCGVFAISNLSVNTELVIPFTGEPVRFSFGLAERFKPFNLSYSAFTGGGFFALELDSGGVRRVEAALEFGGSLSLDLVVASGGVYVPDALRAHVGLASRVCRELEGRERQPDDAGELDGDVRQRPLDLGRDLPVSGSTRRRRRHFQSRGGAVGPEEGLVGLDGRMPVVLDPYLLRGGVRAQLGCLHARQVDDVGQLDGAEDRGGAELLGDGRDVRERSQLEPGRDRTLHSGDGPDDHVRLGQPTDLARVHRQRYLGQHPEERRMLVLRLA